MQNNPSLLILDDDPKITYLMEKFLGAYGYAVTIAGDDKDLFELIANEKFDLIILDVMLPGDDGFKVCRKIRETKQTPIMMLTAVGTDTERIMGLELGADDYLTKPFNPHELLARIRAILRRINADIDSPERPPTKLVFLGWTLDKLMRRLISPEGLDVALTDGEYRLLEALADRPQMVQSRDALLEMTQSKHAGPYDRSIDVRISRLRQKIESDLKQPSVIKTVRGGGYIFTAKVDKYA